MASEEPKTIRAAGAVVGRSGPNGPQILLVHRPRFDDWTIPKGKNEPGEIGPVAAVREVMEETGVTIRLGPPLPTSRYRVGDRDKTVEYWCGIVVGEHPHAPDHEVDLTAWVDLAEAPDRLSYDLDRDVCEAYAAHQQTTALVLVRHGEAQHRKSWSDHDDKRPLTPMGRREADGLIPLLAAYGVRRLVSPPAKRCVTTLQPYADEIDKRIRLHADLSEQAGEHHPEAAAKRVRKLRDTAIAKDRPTAICLHRPVLPYMLAALELDERKLHPAEVLVVHVDRNGTAATTESYDPPEV